MAKSSGQATVVKNTGFKPGLNDGFHSHFFHNLLSTICWKRNQSKRKKTCKIMQSSHKNPSPFCFSLILWFYIHLATIQSFIQLLANIILKHLCLVKEVIIFLHFSHGRVLGVRYNRYEIYVDMDAIRWRMVSNHAVASTI
jgi:hypothetical protein